MQFKKQNNLTSNAIKKVGIKLVLVRNKFIKFPINLNLQ